MSTRPPTRLRSPTETLSSSSARTRHGPTRSSSQVLGDARRVRIGGCSSPRERASRQSVARPGALPLPRGCDSGGVSGSGPLQRVAPPCKQHQARWPARTCVMRELRKGARASRETPARRTRQACATAADSLPRSDRLQALGGRGRCQSNVMTTLPLARPCSTYARASRVWSNGNVVSMTGRRWPVS
jgi:hypothetical protein